MELKPTVIADLFVVTSSILCDSRGEFSRLFCDQELNRMLGTRTIKQINRSRTVNVGAIRGLHFQRSPHSEMKMVRCLKGRVWDVVVDLRRNSETFLHWYAEEISETNALMLLIPEGCAHGFQVLEADSELLYLHTACYEAAAEGGLRFDDPALGIAWPLPMTVVSERDRAHPLINKEFQGVSL